MSTRLAAVILAIFGVALFSSLSKAADAIIEWESSYDPDQWIIYYTVNTIEQEPFTVAGTERSLVLTDVPNGIHVVSGAGVVDGVTSDPSPEDSAFILEFVVTIRSQ